MSGWFSKKVLPTMPTIPVINPEPKREIIGHDGYHHDAWDLKTLKTDFVFLKATEGTSHVDDKFKEWRQILADRNIPCGAYHFLRGGNISAQISNFLTVVQEVKRGELPPVLDWESRDAKSDAEAMDWLVAIESRLGVKPILYTYPSFIEETGVSKEFAKHPLWIAHYGTNKPRIPKPWTSYLIHQFAEGQAGTAYRWDTNRFSGSFEDLQNLRKK